MVSYMWGWTGFALMALRGSHAAYRLIIQPVELNDVVVMCGNKATIWPENERLTRHSNSA